MHICMYIYPNTVLEEKLKWIVFNFYNKTYYSVSVECPCCNAKTTAYFLFQFFSFLLILYRLSIHKRTYIGTFI